MDQLGLEASEVKLDTSFVDDLADSLDLVEVVMRLEGAFALEIPDGNAEKIRTAQDAVD
jgi:acyl carrier protein